MYKTANLKPETMDLVEQAVALMELRKQGPYGGYGGSVSKNDAIAYACKCLIASLPAVIDKEAREKRAKAAANRTNNNPGLTPGVSRRK
jgi:hypothetical protein